MWNSCERLVLIFWLEIVIVYVADTLFPFHSLKGHTTDMLLNHRIIVVGCFCCTIGMYVLATSKPKPSFERPTEHFRLEDRDHVDSDGAGKQHNYSPVPCDGPL
jgi:hypothetical protein